MTDEDKNDSWWNRYGMHAVIILSAVIVAIAIIASGCEKQSGDTASTEASMAEETQGTTESTAAEEATIAERSATTTSDWRGELTRSAEAYYEWYEQYRSKVSAEKAIREAYVDSTKAIEFRVLEKNPSKHKGERLRFTGQIVEIIEQDNYTAIRLSVTKEIYGYSPDDLVMVEYSGTMDAYRDDVIRIWGRCDGDFTYESQAGWSITLPLIRAKYWEKL